MLNDDDKVEYAELNHQHRHPSNPAKTVAESSSFGMQQWAYIYIRTQHVCCSLAIKINTKFPEVIDDSITLDSLLIQLRSQVTPIWYKFGLALGISKDTLSRYIGYPPTIQQPNCKLVL